MTSIKQAQAFQNVIGARYAKITVTDAYYSNPVFYVSDASIIATNVQGGPVTYPVVESWGEFTKGSDTVGYAIAVGEFSLIGNAILVPTSSVARLKVCEWIRRVNFMDALVEVFQWNKFDTTQEMIWSGYVENVDTARSSAGRQTVEFYLTDEPKSFSTILVGDLVTDADFPAAPPGSIGKMPSRTYGRADGKLFSLAHRNSPAYMGFPMAGARGVIIDENQVTTQLKIRFHKNDGTSAAHTFAEPTANDPSTVGDLWVYDPGMSAYGLVDADSYSVVNDVNKLEVIVDQAPKIFFFIRPSLKGSKNAAAFTDLYKLVDGDPNNFVESTSTDFIWAFDCPEVSFNGNIRSVSMIIDVDNVHPTKNRTIRFGFWDVYETSLGAGLLNGGAGTDISKPTGSSRSLTFLITRYVASDFKNHKGRDTIAEFKSGRFVTADTSDANEANLQLYAEVLELGGAHSGKDQVRMRGMAMVVEVVLPMIPTENQYTWWQQSAVDIGVLGQRRKAMLDELGVVRKSYAETKASRLTTLRGMDFFARGIGQKDDGSGSITDDGAGAVIAKPCDVARHMLLEAGQTINDTASSLGNFDDARASGGVMNSMDENFMQFGPERVTVKEALQDMCDRFPMTLVKRKKIWDCIPDDLNPHVSRSYRSSSEEVWIGKNDIDIADFDVTRIPPKDIQNSVILQYAHGYPNREPAENHLYDNPISQLYYGKKETITIPEPWVIKFELSTAVDAGAEELTRWYGRRTGRSRLIVTAGLTQKYYDLEIGQVVEFYGLEDIGIECTAYRCGLLDYQFQSASSSTNYADSATPLYVAGSGTGKIYFGVSQQLSGLDFFVAVAAAFTTVGAADGSEAWSYMGIGTALTALTGVSNGNALKSTGAQSVRWTRPRADLVHKQELTFGSVKAGPCYWYTMDYNTATATGSGNARSSYNPVWAGLRFITMKHTIPPARDRAYPRRRTKFLEVI